MDENFELPVQYENQCLLLPAQLQTWQYGHRILVTLDGQILIFEPDEERNYRAVLRDSQVVINKSLVQCIASAIEILFK